MSESPTISVGKLRQNPTEELRKVRAGAEYVITDRGVSVARLVPLDESRWIPADRAALIFAVPTDPTWGDELRLDRDAITVDDPWAK